MKIKLFSLFLIASVAFMNTSTTANAATVVYNSTPAEPFFYGTGNGYRPANAAVLTAGGGQIALRLHETFFQASPSNNAGVYTFALGPNKQISFDWSITSISPSARTSSLITLTNLATNRSVSYNPFFPGNDNAFLESTLGSTFQNSARLNFGVFNAIQFNPNASGRYQVKFDSDFGQGLESLTVSAQLGAVPEPATWAMMIVGFGFVGAAKRRRSAMHQVHV